MTIFLLNNLIMVINLIKELLHKVMIMEMILVEKNNLIIKIMSIKWIAFKKCSLNNNLINWKIILIKKYHSLYQKIEVILIRNQMGRKWPEVSEGKSKTRTPQIYPR